MKIQDCPPDLPESGADSIYSYENLPSKHQKKYIYASRFIHLVRSKTPKITYYSAQGKCELMENLDHFEVSFYDGSKIVQTSAEQVKLTDSDDHPIALTCITDENNSARGLWLHYQQCLEHCKVLEQTLSSISSNGECFPVIVGRRPATAPILSSLKSQSNNIITPKMPNVRAFFIFTQSFLYL